MGSESTRRKRQRNATEDMKCGSGVGIEKEIFNGMKQDVQQRTGLSYKVCRREGLWRYPINTVHKTL